MVEEGEWQRGSGREGVVAEEGGVGRGEGVVRERRNKTVTMKSTEVLNLSAYHCKLL